MRFQWGVFLLSVFVYKRARDNFCETSAQRLNEVLYIQVFAIMRKNIVLLVLTLLIFNYVASVKIPRIAIIGGGIGGASTSHFLTELLNDKLKIDLYDAKTIGGRLATVRINNYDFEAGGSIIHTKNMYMQKFIELLGLEKISDIGGESMGVWTGDEFICKGSSLVIKAQLFLRYGSQVPKLLEYVSKILEDFMRIYDLQDAGRSFNNVTTLLAAINKDFPQLLQISAKDHFLHMGFSEKLIDELVQASIVANYGQDVNIQSFVSLVSLTAAIPSDDGLWSVKGGNKLVPKHLISKNKNVNVLPSRVTKIRYLADNSDSSQYEITYVNKDNTDPITSNYDIVIIATPLTRDQAFPIEFVGFPEVLSFPGTFQTTHATFVNADLNPKYFGISHALDDIISSDPDKTKFSAIGKQGPVDGPTKKDLRVWKIFSRNSIDNLINKMFSNIDEKKEVVWKMSPHYSTEERHDKFKLHDALYHVNAIEWAASAMEMSSIAGRNVALLASNDFLQKHDSTLSENHAYMSHEL